MDDKQPRYFATLGELTLRIWDSDGGFSWRVTHSRTGEEVTRGESVHLENAMVGAAQAAQAEWGALRWHSPGEEQT